MRTLQTISTTDTKYFDVYYHQICMGLWGLRPLDPWKHSNKVNGRQLGRSIRFMRFLPNLTMAFIDR